MEQPGLRLKEARNRLDLTYREVEEASSLIADRHKNDEYAIGISRLADIENRGTVPSMFRAYSLGVIYRLDFLEILQWYGLDLPQMGPDALEIRQKVTGLFGIKAQSYGDVQVPIALDPGFDLRRTTFLSRQIQRWGRLPLSLLSSLDLKNHRYGFIGTEDWFMYPLLQPGSFVLIDESLRKIVSSGWQNEFERPIYFLEHREGYACCWCTLAESQIILQPHPASNCHPRIHGTGELDVIGQVTGFATRLDPGRKRRTRS